MFLYLFYSRNLYLYFHIEISNSRKYFIIFFERYLYINISIFPGIFKLDKVYNFILIPENYKLFN